MVILNNVVYLAMNQVGDVSSKTDSFEQKLRVAAFDFPNAAFSYVKE